MDNDNPKRSEGIKQWQVVLVSALVALGFDKLLSGLSDVLPFRYSWQELALAFGLLFIALGFWTKWQKGW